MKRISFKIICVFILMFCVSCISEQEQKEIVIKRNDITKNCEYKTSVGYTAPGAGFFHYDVYQCNDGKIEWVER